MDAVQTCWQCKEDFIQFNWKTFWKYTKLQIRKLKWKTVDGPSEEDSRYGRALTTFFFFTYVQWDECTSKSEASYFHE